MSLIVPLDQQPQSENKHRPDVIFTFSFETWVDALERELGRPPDRFVEWLETVAEVNQIIVADPFRSLPVRIAKQVLRRPERPSRPLARGVLSGPHRFVHREYRSPAALTRSYARYEAQLQDTARGAGMGAPRVITVHPIIAGFCEFSWAESVTYWALDDWAVHPDYEAERPAIKAAYERIRARSVPVASVSQVLVDRVGSANSVLVPNAVDGREFEHPWPAPTWFVSPSGPRVVYQGSIDRRLDAQALGSIADAIGTGTLFLVGPIIDRTHLDAVTSRPNVVLTDNLSRSDLLGVLGAADLGVVPHAVTSLTEAMSPLKLYEYLASGCPVVATDLAPMRNVSRRVRLVNNPLCWGEETRRGIALGRATDAERSAFVANNNWNRRFESLLFGSNPLVGQ